jgi:hypothetical protein
MQDLQKFMIAMSRIDCAASNTTNSINQSRSGIPVSMSGSLLPVTQ